MAHRRRLDAELVRRQLVESREQAKREIADGGVLVNGSLAAKAAHLVASSDDVRLVGPPPRFVSRAGGKLQGALERFDVSVKGLTVCDAGSSTGGFTDCVLQNGADRVLAVDVGTHQLHERLRRDPRVFVFEQTDIRTFVPDNLVDLVVGDLSFISLRSVIGPLRRLVAEGSSLILLVKPQFEAGKEEASRGRGVIRDPEVWTRVLREVGTYAHAEGARLIDLMVSPVRGSAGNVEFVAHFVAVPQTSATVDDDGQLEEMIAAAVGETGGEA